MLSRLFIENVALIRRLEIGFEPGFNVLTGETGAGKSIIIDAVNLVLGERAAKELIKHGADNAKVVAVFDVSNYTEADAALESLGIEKEDELILSRELSLAGKNVCRINGSPVTLASLKRVSDMLVDIHGQHEHQALMDVSLHIDFLDMFGGSSIAFQKSIVNNIADQYHQLKKEMLSGFMTESEREREMDMLAFQIKEIEDAKLLEGECESLKNERIMLRNSEKIMDAMENAYDALCGNGDAISTLKRAVRELHSIAQYSETYSALADNLNDTYYALEDAGLELRELRNAFEFEPQRIDAVEQRLDLIASLKRKYGDCEAEILKYKNAGELRLEALKNSAEQNEKYKAMLANLKEKYTSEAEKLTTLRKEASLSLKERLLAELRELGLGNARFDTVFISEYDKEPNLTGMDVVEFMLSANSGEALKPLALVASGGEMSRIMLAFKAVFADNDNMGTLIFDEIDTGISGKAAAIVGEKMKRISKNHQVICITHLPQIAAMGDWHQDVQKKDDGRETRVEVHQLDKSAREKTIARMLGGNEFDDTALLHAQKIISKK